MSSIGWIFSFLGIVLILISLISLLLPNMIHLNKTASYSMLIGGVVSFAIGMNM